LMVCELPLKLFRNLKIKSNWKGGLANDPPLPNWYFALK
jgi:hypothetical protein